MPQNMGLLYGLERSNVCVKRADRWLFEVPGVCADDTPGVDALPPSKSARPNLSFKEMEVRHVMEDVYYPCKPEWKPIALTLFDVVKSANPVWGWITKVYRVQQGRLLPPVRSGQLAPQMRDRFVKDCYLKLFSGCGNLVETWLYEDAWPNNINFQSVDMGSSSFLTCDITLRYARAYLVVASAAAG